MRKSMNRSREVLFFLTVTILAFLPAGRNNSTGLCPDMQEYVQAKGEIVVLFDREVSDADLKDLKTSLYESVDIVRHIGDYVLLSVKDSAQYGEILRSLENDPQVKAVQPNVSISSMGITDDTYSDTQWAIDNTGHYIYLTEAGKQERPAVEGVDMDVKEAWELSGKQQGSNREVVVAVIDTGVDYTHPDLKGHMWMNENEIPNDGIDNDNNGYTDDIYGWDFYNDDATVCHYKYYPEYSTNLALPEDNDDHGTHVAGIIAATANNGIGIAGIASNVNVKIMSLKINGGPKGTGTVSSAIEAVKYATMMGADICNLSWGTAQYTKVLKQVISESDMLFVAAAGNSGTDNNITPLYPASLELDNLISVTFIDSSGRLNSLSNYGSDTIDLAAPGEDIYSTIVGNYAALSGSSMAAPHVSAVAAMLYAYSDHLYPSNVREILLENIKPLKGLDGYIINPGIPSAYQALSAADSLLEDTKAPTMSFSTKYDGLEMTVPIKIEDKGGSGIRVVKWIFGKRTLTDFHRGTVGTAVKKNQINVARSGVYTFYASDYAGNEAIQFYHIDEDKQAPSVSAYYTVKDNYRSRTITVKVSDSESGIAKVKYMSGIRAASEFLPAGAGKELTLNSGLAVFKVVNDGTYTIFATDNRGNSTVKRLQVKAVKATGIKLPGGNLTLTRGDRHQLRPYLKPVDTTDLITYSSSDKSIATVSSTGLIKALKPGTAYITAMTSSGMRVICKVSVIK